MSSFLKIAVGKKIITLRVKSISLDPQIKTVIKPYVGSGGSSTLRSGTGGRLLDITIYADDDDIANIESIVAYEGYITLASISKASYNGQYYLIQQPFSEKKKGIFEVSMKLQERAVFNAIYMNFKSYDIVTKPFNPTIKIGKKWSTS